MKHIFFLILAFVAMGGYGQVSSQVQAKRGVFTEQLFLKDRWINRFSTNLNSDDSTSHSALATVGAVRTAGGNFIQNQLLQAQTGNFFTQGIGVIGSHNSFRNTLSSGYPAQLCITQGSGTYGLSIQRSGADKEPADVVFLKNYGFSFNTPAPLTIGDSIGAILFTGVTHDRTTIDAPMSLNGRVEKSTPSFLSSGFIFNLTDNNGVNNPRMGISANGNLMVGNANTNTYKLNVANGLVGFSSLSGAGDILAGSDNTGVVGKVIPTSNLFIADSTLTISPPQPVRKKYLTYTAILTQSGTNDPQVRILENDLGENMAWIRDSAGHYTGSVVQFVSSGTSWFHSQAIDLNGIFWTTRLYRGSDSHSVKLVVKDTDYQGSDGWQILVEIRLYQLG